MESNEVPGINIEPKKSFYRKKIFSIAILVVALFFLVGFLFAAPSDFPEGDIFSVKEGWGLRKVSLELKNKNIIRSQAVFEALVILNGGEKRVISADYLFEEKMSAWEIARRIAKGERHLAPIKITIPEGFTKEEIANLTEINLPAFNKQEFLVLAKDREGYLFPDTYFFFSNATASDVFKSLSDNFEKKVSPLRPDISESKKKETDIINMASIIEKESKGEGDRSMISGILWKRISIGMALQADAAPETYDRRGLPRRPIANPGVSSIRAAIFPKSSPYLYYIHDKTGDIHYARNFAEHRQNIERYLK